MYLFNKINSQLEREGKGKAILFCGPSNRSVDLVAGELIIHFLQCLGA